MSKKSFLVIQLFLLFGFNSHSQEHFPSVTLKSVSGKTIDFSQLAASSNDTMVVMSFWATWCIPCITELENINDVLEEKQKEKPFQFITVSIDDSRTEKRVKPFIKGKLV